MNSKELRRRYEAGERNFSNLDLKQISFTFADLSYSNFSGCNLIGADLRWTNLTGVNFESAFLNGANLLEANLSDANFARANLHCTNLENIFCTDKTIFPENISLDKYYLLAPGVNLIGLQPKLC
ncbi:MAG: pentapeptide repeat-containing protein [Xenococcaceae cyanobacterium]